MLRPVPTLSKVGQVNTSNLFHLKILRLNAQGYHLIVRYPIFQGVLIFLCEICKLTRLVPFALKHFSFVRLALPTSDYYDTADFL